MLQCGFGVPWWVCLQYFTMANERISYADIFSFWLWIKLTTASRLCTLVLMTGFVNGEIHQQHVNNLHMHDRLFIICHGSYHKCQKLWMYQISTPADLESGHFEKISSQIFQMWVQLQCVELTTAKTNELHLRITITAYLMHDAVTVILNCTAFL